MGGALSQSSVPPSFPTDGGLAGYYSLPSHRLEELVDESVSSLPHPVDEYLAEKLIAAGIPIVQPRAGSGVTSRPGLLPHIPPNHSPESRWYMRFNLEGGVRPWSRKSVFGCRPTVLSRCQHGSVPSGDPRGACYAFDIDYVAELYRNAVRASSLELRSVCAAFPDGIHGTVRTEGQSVRCGAGIGSDAQCATWGPPSTACKGAEGAIWSISPGLSAPGRWNAPHFSKPPR